MKHEIDIEGLPEGWRPVEFRIGMPGDSIIDCGVVLVLDSQTKFPCLIVEKIQPRRIVLEETNNENMRYEYGEYETQIFNNGISLRRADKLWREVNETTDDKLSLSVEECNQILVYGLHHTELVTKLKQFIKVKS